MPCDDASKAIYAVRLLVVVAATGATVVSLRARADDDEPRDPVATAKALPPSSIEPGVIPVARPPADRTAGDVAGQPIPGNESGRLDRIDGGDSMLRIAARGVLFVPRVALKVVFAPLRGAVWANERFELQERWRRYFWNDAHTIGLYPTAAYESGLGLVGGARFVHKQLFGQREQLALQAAVGVIYRQSHALKFRTGDRFGSRLELGLDANFDRLPTNPFYGIGNSDVVDPPPTAIDPRVDSTAVKTDHRYQELRGAVSADVRFFSDAHAILRGALTDIELAAATTGPAIDGVYDPAGLVGFEDGVNGAYGELELRWDTRHRRNIVYPDRVLRAGSLASVFAGRMAPFGSDALPGFWHYGAELQHFMRLAGGPRVLVLRLHGEGVTGSLDEVPFIELPYLGGSSFLRGYSFERFRDRFAAVGSAQYIWDVSHNLDAYLFVDAGRVYPALDELTLDGLRVGYGLGIDVHDSRRGFIAEASIASSIDGGVVLSLSFNPVLDARPRWR